MAHYTGAAQALGTDGTSPLKPATPLTAAVRLLQPRITPEELPAARPPAWDYCGWGCALESSLEGRPNGALVARVAHGPLPGVTTDMLRWWFNGNIDGIMRHPVDGKVYPRYLTWHSRDHIDQHTVSPGPSPSDATGARWSITEFFLSDKPTGWVKGDDPGEWGGQMYTKVILAVLRLGPSDVSIGFRLPVSGLTPLYLTHEWSPSPGGAMVVSTMYIGLPEGSGPYTRAANTVVKAAFGGDDPEAAARAWQLHALEEMGNLKYFLPDLYAACSGASGADADGSDASSCL